MKNNINSKNGFIHLYNPKKEGLGSYDVHYINAYKKKNSIQTKNTQSTNERNVA